MQYDDTGMYQVIFVVLMVIFILFNISRAKGSKSLFIRRIPGLNAIDEAIGRATEMGRPVLMVPGIGDETQIGVTAQALAIFANVTKVAIRFGTPIRLCCANATTYALATEIIRDVYQSEGMIEQFEPETVQFVSDRQFAFAAGISGLIHRDQMAATFFLGAFYAESLIFAETANSIGAIQVAGSTQNTQTPFFIAACDYVLIADEFYAASAYLSREPVLVGSLVGQDWCKIMVGFAIIIGFLSVSGQTLQQIDRTLTEDGRWIDADQVHFTKREETYAARLFAPIRPPKGTPVSNPPAFDSVEAYLADRKSALALDGEPTPGATQTIDENSGQWYEFMLKEGDSIRRYEEFIGISDGGRVTLLRSLNGRIQMPKVETPAEGGGA